MTFSKCYIKKKAPKGRTRHSNRDQTSRDLHFGEVESSTDTRGLFGIPYGVIKDISPI